MCFVSKENCPLTVWRWTLKVFYLFIYLFIYYSINNWLCLWIFIFYVFNSICGFYLFVFVFRKCSFNLPFVSFLVFIVLLSGGVLLQINHLIVQSALLITRLVITRIRIERSRPWLLKLTPLGGAFASVIIRAGTNTPSDEYDSYREYRVANTNMYSRIHFFLRGY